MVEKDLNPWAVGCYASQIRIKQKHRQLEGELALVEKMLSQAEVRGLLAYPENELEQAVKALLFCEFHDILPGTSIAPVEEMSLATLDGGLAIVNRLKQRAFFALLAGEKKAEEGEYPIFFYNPHPHPEESDFTCEFQLANQNWTDRYAMPEIFQDGSPLPFQVEKESCNMNLDWRKRVTFHAVLKPACMNRFSVRIRMLDPAEKEKTLMPKRGVKHDAAGESMIFETEELRVEISKRTGLLNAYRVDGRDYLEPGAGALVVMKTDCDPWGMNRHSYREERGRFTLLPREEGSRYSGVSNERHAGDGVLLDSLRIVEQGEVRTVVEAVFGYGNSRACIRYLIPAKGKALEMQVHVDWMEKGSLLKLEFLTCLRESVPYTETAYGVNTHMPDGEEKAMHGFCVYLKAQEKSRRLYCSYRS